MPIIFLIIVVLIVFYVKKNKKFPNLFEWARKFFTVIFKYIIYGAGIYVSKWSMMIADKARLKEICILISYLLLFFASRDFFLSYGLMTFAILSFLIFIALINHNIAKKKEKKYKDIIDCHKNNLRRCMMMMAAILFFAEGVFLAWLFEENVGFFYFFAFSSIIYLTVNLIIERRNSRIANKFYKVILEESYFDFDAICKKFSIPHNKYDLCRIELAKCIYDEKICEVLLGTTNYYINVNFFNDLKKNIYELFEENPRIEKDDFIVALKSQFNLPEPLLEDFIHFYFEDIGSYEFDDGEYYLPDFHRNQIVICACCGMASLIDADTQFEGEWYCSDLCRETEELCEQIIQMPKFIEANDDFEMVGTAAAIGAAAWGTGQYWIEQIKIVSQNTQGHGFAAERANTIIDKMSFKDAHVLGDDNAVNGADRIVNGQLIQSKYCETAYKSVHEAFVQKGGSVPYRYMDADGKPMQLEVPKDQYTLAVKEMEKRISNGEVPGVSDPNEAKNIIRKGNITYKQAQNITKFGTVESLAYDAVHGVVVAGSAAGISFVISTAITYWKTQDINLAVKASVVQSIKAGGKAFAIYVVSAQMQRIPAVTNFLNNAIQINFTNSPTGKYIAQQLAGKTATGKPVAGKQLNKKANTAVRGAVAAATAAIAVQSTIEIIRMARGRISGMQCVKNITVATAGIAAGTVGSLVGGVLFSPIPVVGPLIGSAVVGSLTGMIASKGAKKVMDVFIQDDSQKMLALIMRYIEYIAVEFALNENELDIISKELDGYITANQTIFEDIFASKNRRSKINSFIKPMVVNVVRHREKIEYEVFDDDKIAEALSA